MARIENVEAVKKQLKQMHKEATSESVIVGYTANYALYVHENTEMKLKGQKRQPPGKGKYWDPQGRAQSKFLATPARELQDEIGAAIVKTYDRTRMMGKSLLVGGLYLQRESQKLVPVDTGNLKASAFTRLE
jgi:hypothetical protein